MADRATVTYHTSTEIKSRLERLAKAARRSKPYLRNEAFERYLEAEEGIVDAVLQGIGQADAVDLIRAPDVRQT